MLPASDILTVSCLCLGVGLTFLLSPRWGWVFLAIGTLFLGIYLGMVSESQGSERWIEGAAAFILTCALSAVAVRIRKARESGRDGLEYQGIHASNSRSYPANESSDPLWIAVSNKTLTDAKRVTARVSFKNNAGTQAIPAMDCRWHQNTERDGMIGGGWVKALDILSRDDQSFVLLDTAKNNEVWVRDASESPIACLQFGEQWTATLAVESENMSGFEGTVDFDVTRRGVTNLKFAKLRDVQPRLST